MYILTDDRLSKAIVTDTYIEAKDLKEMRKQPSIQELYIELHKYEKLMEKYNIKSIEELEMILKEKNK